MATANTLTRGTNFDPKVVADLVSKVRGKSSLAKLSKQIPVSFNGTKEFTFTFDNEIDIVAENGAKSAGGAQATPVTIVPIKFEYGARVSDEFMYASEEERINVLKEFNEGFAKKVARGLDIAAMHGLNPRTLTASAVIGANHFDSKVTQTVTGTGNIDADIESAVGLVLGSDAEVTGMAASNGARQSLANVLTTDGARVYPELAWGGNPDSVNGLSVDFNSTVGIKDVDDAIVGDFENMFHWGYAKEIPMKVIEYGDPDNTGSDLQGHNQVYIRAEVYLGWGILDPNSFARVLVED